MCLQEFVNEFVTHVANEVTGVDPSQLFKASRHLWNVVFSLFYSSIDNKSVLRRIYNARPLGRCPLNGI